MKKNSFKTNLTNLIIHADGEALEGVGREDGGDPHEGGEDQAQQEHHQTHPHHTLSSGTCE